MSQKIKTTLLQSLPAIIIATLLVGVIIYAWTEPSQAPPGGNVPVPINVGSATQYKSGALGIGGLFRAYSNAIFDGNVGIGTTNPGAKLDVAGNIKSNGQLVCLANGTNCLAVSTNADTVDGLHAGSFLRRDANDSLAGGVRIGFNGSGITSGSAYGIGNGMAYNNLNSIAVDTLETDSGVGGGGVLELIYYGGSYVTIGPSGTKPLFTSIVYDGNNAGYYVDPNGTTRLNAVTPNIIPLTTGDSPNAGYNHYAIYEQPGAWTHPYPDLMIEYHTGISYIAYYGYGGHRFYTGYSPDASPTTLAFSVGEFDNNTRVYNNLYVSGTAYANGQALCQANGTNCPAAANLGDWYFSGDNIVSNGWGHIYTSSSNLHLDSYSGEMYLNYYYNNWVNVGNRDTGYLFIGNTQLYDDNDWFRIYSGANNRIYTNSYLRIDNGFEVNGRIYANEWIQMNNYSGLYSPNNGAHFYPNNGSYGSWRVAGSRNGWYGLEFDTVAGQTTFMMGTTGQGWGSQMTGVHNNSYGWLWRWDHGTLAVGTVPWGNISKPGNLTYWDTWYGSSYLGSNGDLYMGWDGRWLSQTINQDVRGGASPTFAAVTAGAYYGPGCDIAERYAASGSKNSLEAGDIVELNKEQEGKIQKSSASYSPAVIGVISTNPNMVMGALEATKDYPPVALLGRVPTKVTNENGPIKIGDLIVSSSRPGYGMKCDDYSKCQGAVIGKALQNFDGQEGKIGVLIKGGF